MKTFLVMTFGLSFLFSASQTASACDKRCGQSRYQQVSYPQTYYPTVSYSQAAVPAAPAVPAPPALPTPPVPPTPPVAPAAPVTPAVAPAERELPDDVKALIRDAVDRALAEERARSGQPVGSRSTSQSINRDSSFPKPAAGTKPSQSVVVRPSISGGERP